MAGTTVEQTPRNQREEGYLKLLASLATSGTGAELGVVRRIAVWIDSPRVIEQIAGHESWFDDWAVKEAFVRNEATPESIRSRSAMAVGVLDLLRELDTAEHSDEEREEILEHTRQLIRGLPPRDREAVKARAYALSSSRQEPEEEAAPAAIPATPPERQRELDAAFETASLDVPVTPGDEPEAADPASDDEIGLEDPAVPQLVEAPPLTASTAAGASDDDAGAADTAAASNERLLRAQESRDRQELRRLATDSSDRVRLAVIANPAVDNETLASIARTASPQVAREIYRNRNLFIRPTVRRALLECPNVPSAALVEVVSSMGDLRGLLGLTQSPKVKSLEVKSRARARLTSLFRGLGPAEKISTVRRSGRPLLKALWTDFFRDEELVLRCLKERHVDPGLVLEIARSSVAPRRALAHIGETPSLSANYQVRVALVRNPKTPRPIAHRLAKTLKSEDREALAGAASGSP